MVDIHAAKVSGATLADGHQGRVAVDIRPADDIALADYDQFCASAVYGVGQNPVWVRAWIEATGCDALIVSVRRAGRQIVALALEVVREGPFRIARYPGGDHANGNFPAVARDGAKLSEDDAKAICEAIHDARPDIDLVYLQRQNPRHSATENALVELSSVQSPNVSLAVDLSGGFDGVMTRRHGKKKRKKYRLQVRKFEELGGYRIITASTPQEVDRLIDAFFDMKAARFAVKGIPNVFGPIEVQTFFRNLFTEALAHKEPPYRLHAVEVNGELAAINGCSILGHSWVCEFGGIREDASNSSPGYFLDFHCIEEAAKTGRALYDFSVGDEVYKRSWCDVETYQFDTLMPLTTKGRAAWALEMARAHAVRMVKSNSALWSLVKQLRAKVAGTKSPATED